jgi:putative methyltransferase
VPKPRPLLSPRYNLTRRSRSIPVKLVREGSLHLLPVYYLLRLSDLGCEAIEHSGSSRFADHIYCGIPSGRNVVGRWLDARLLAMPAAEAFRRRCINAQAMMRRALEARAHGPIRILGVPCGIPRDVIELARTLRSEDRGLLSRIEYEGLDVDPDVLAIARRLTCDCGLGADRYRQGNALDRNDYPPGRFDLVVSTGLGEFLDDAELAAFYGIVFETLESGGVFYTSATAKDPKSDLLLQMIELETHYRGVEALRGILTTLPWARFELIEDSSRLQTFVIAVK